jgi:hypothetical protein
MALWSFIYFLLVLSLYCFEYLYLFSKQFNRFYNYVDITKFTLIFFVDDESLSSASINSGLASKKGYIPRRLVIGNDE